VLLIQDLFSTWIEGKSRLWNSFDLTNSNRNFSSNEWMTDFIFCDSFKTTCKQASMPTGNPPLYLYLDVVRVFLSGECECVVFGKEAGRGFSIVKARSLFCVMMMNGSMFSFFLFLYCKCWANLPKSQHESRPAAA
jgi:hypothetical protein